MGRPTNNPRVAAVILAAGAGVRMGGKLKQFLKLNGTPVFFYCLKEFIRSGFIQKIIVVVPSHKEKIAKQLTARLNSTKSITFIAGGDTRQESIFKALKYLNQQTQTPDYVIFHDAVRPIISRRMISLIFKAAVRHNGSVAANKMTEFVVEANKGFIEKTERQEKKYTAATPQCFRFQDILSAHQKWGGYKNLKSGDNLELLLLANKKYRIRIIKTPYPNLKITHKADIKIIGLLLRYAFQTTPI